MGVEGAQVPFFSIVMPVYQAEAYVQKAVESIQAQTFSDWELIAVVDCSPDRSGEILDQCAEKDNRIQVVHLDKNRGVSEARNRGICHAKGRYLWFVDADDSVEATVLKECYKSLVENPAKLLIFGLVEEYYAAEGSLVYQNPRCPEEKVFRSKEELRPYMIYLEQQTLYGYPWNKIYDLDYLKQSNVRFTDYRTNKFIEDITFNIEYCMDIDSLNLLAITPYHYAKRAKDSLTNEFVPEYYTFHKRRIELLLEQYRYWGLVTIEVKRILGSLYARYILSALQRNCDKRAKMTHSMRYKWCKGVFGQELFRVLIPEAEEKDSKTLGFALKFLRGKHTMGCLALGRLIYIAKNKLPIFYSKVKSGR